MCKQKASQHRIIVCALLNLPPPTAPPKGIAGYAWVVALHLGIGLSFPATLLLALVLPVAWLAVYHFVLAEAPGAYRVRVVVLCGRTKKTSAMHVCM